MGISKLFGILCWVWVSSEMLLQLVTRTTRKSGKVSDRGSLPLLLLAIFVSIWVASWYSSAYPHPMLGGAHWLKPAALLLMVAGLVVRWTAIFTLGLSFSTNVAIHANQTLRRTGLFKWVRHPSYTRMVLSFTALGLFQRNWVSLAIVLVFPIAALLYRIHVEEMALTGAFGEDYVAYSRKTSCLFPGIY